MKLLEFQYQSTFKLKVSTIKSVESLIQVSQYFVFFFVSLKEKNAGYVFNGGFKTGF